MSIIADCARSLSAAIDAAAVPDDRRFEVQHEPGCLRFVIHERDESGALAPTRFAEFVRDESAFPAVSPNRLALWASAFVQAQLDDPPALSQASLGLLHRGELADLAAMLAAMRDVDYGLFADQILEASGDDQEQIVEAVRAGNWLWVEDLLRENPALARLEVDGEPLSTIAEECLEPGGERVREMLARANG